MWSAQIFGIIITESSQLVLDAFPTNLELGGTYANLIMIGCLVIGVILTTFIKEDLRRQEGELKLSVGSVPSRLSLHSMTRISR